MPTFPSSDAAALAALQAEIDAAVVLAGSRALPTKAWVTATAYLAGQMVTNGGHTYTANDAHTSGATFAGDLAGHWTLLPITYGDVGAASAAQGTTADGSVQKSLADAKGDLFVGTADNTVARKAAGTNGKFLKADSGQSDGLLWDYVAGPAVKPVTGQYYAPPGPTSSGTRAAGRQTFIPFFLAKDTTFDRIACNVLTVSSSGSVVRLGIYNDNAGTPGTLVLDAGTVVGDSGTGVKAITISQALTAGVYWLSACGQGGVTSPTMDGYTGNAILPYGPSLAATLRQGFGFYQDSITGAFAGSPTVSVGDLALLVALRAA